MKQLYKHGCIKIKTTEELKTFNYREFQIKQIEQIGENLYAVEILEKGQYIDILRY